MAIVKLSDSPYGNQLAETCKGYFDKFEKEATDNKIGRVTYRAYGRNAPEDDTEILIIFQTNGNGLHIAVNWIAKEEYEKLK